MTPGERDSFGTASVLRLEDGTVRVLVADDTIGIAPELLANGDLHVDDDGRIWLDPAGEYRYRPIRFAAYRVVVCERVR